MAETEMKKVKRSAFAVFINTTPGAEKPTWARMGKGITEQTVAYNPSVTSETYIDEDAATSNVDSYSVNISTPQTCYAGEPVFEYVDGLRRSRAIGSDCETDVLMVYMYKAGTGENTYAAEKNKAVIQIDDFGGPAGGGTTINYTVNLNGDPEIGTATVASGEITFTATAAA